MTRIIALKGKKIKIELLFGAAFVLICTGLVGMFVRPGFEPDKVLRARFGDVPWNHEQHARMAEISNCTVCHHTEMQGVTRPKPCSQCHKRPDNAGSMVLADLYGQPVQVKYGGEQGPPSMQAFHGKCLGCHKAMNLGPMVCRDCHVQNFSGEHGWVTWDHFVHSRKMDTECVRCHHKDTEAASEGDYRTCRTCHKDAHALGQPRQTGISDHGNVKHGECATCHVEYNPENDDRSCATCHKGWAVDPKLNVPCLEEAIHVSCMECHHMNSPEYKDGMPAYCTECHLPDPSWIANETEGSVLWSHRRHAEFSGYDCSECHHTYVEGEPVIGCTQCHDGGHIQGIPTAAEAIQKNCVTCHKKEKAGLETWASMATKKSDVGLLKYTGKDGNSFHWDHRGHAIAYAFACTECHHNTYQKDGKFVTAEKINMAWPKNAGNIQSCANCHGADGPVAASVAFGTKAPDLEGAYKAACLGCHQHLEGGPQTWELIRAYDVPKKK